MVNLLCIEKKLKKVKPNLLRITEIIAKRALIKIYIL